MKRICANCRKAIPKTMLAYQMKIDVFAEPTPLEMTEEDLHRDYRAEMEALIAQLEGVDPEEAEDEVHESYLFLLCASCRREIHILLKSRLFPH